MIARRKLGGTGLKVTELGFGTAPLGNLFRPLPDETARATLAAAQESGFGYYDTAPFYGFGLSERRLGDALRRRKDIVISTKVGRLLKVVYVPDVIGDGIFVVTAYDLHGKALLAFRRRMRRRRQ